MNGKQYNKTYKVRLHTSNLPLLA